MVIMTYQIKSWLLLIFGNSTRIIRGMKYWSGTYNSIFQTDKVKRKANTISTNSQIPSTKISSCLISQLIEYSFCLPGNF